jgi:hypothetical protein
VKSRVEADDVWTLPLPDIAEADAHLTTALTYANGQPVYSLSDAERVAVHAVYHTYNALLGQPGSGLMPDALAACRQHIRDGYNQVQIGGRLAALRATLLSSTDTCPYCGFGEPTELDHYLPKADYNELAIYPRNLVPSCGPCNNAKRTIVPGVGAGPGLIHPYFEALPDVAFMRANVVFNAGSLDVTFRIEDAMLAPALAQMLRYQLIRLKLDDRYPRQINKFLFEQRTAIMMFREMGLPSVALATYFTRSAISLAKNFGRNDWRAALLDALAANADFCTTPELYLGMKLPSDVDGAPVAA